MKKIFIIMLVLNSLILLGQDREPSPWLFRWGDSDQERIFEPDSFKQTSVFTGFQWSNTLPMDNALLNNCVAEHGMNQVAVGSRVFPLNSINQPTWWDRGYYWIGSHFAPFMQYEPTLLLHDTTEGKILRPADLSDPVFGFKHIKGTILSDSTNENYSRLILYKDDLESYGEDSIVLKNIWPQPCFTTREFFGDGSKYFKSTDKNKAMGQTDNYLGRIWFLTINLRRLNSATDNICDDSVVLSLQIPYTLWNSQTGLIKFDSVPISNIDSVENLNYYENRGYSQLMQLSTPEPDTIFNITRNMLPTRTDTSNSTISTAFFTNGDPDLHNPQFSDDSSTYKIKDIDIVVKYYGITNLAIDFVRIESINAHYLLRGTVDSIAPIDTNYSSGRGFITLFTDPDHPKDTANLNKDYIEQPNGIKQIIQSCLDTMKAKSNNWQDAKLFRFYYQDVEAINFTGGALYAIVTN